MEVWLWLSRSSEFCCNFDPRCSSQQTQYSLILYVLQNS
jgi:hypothetical protein